MGVPLSHMAHALPMDLSSTYRFVNKSDVIILSILTILSI